MQPFLKKVMAGLGIGDPDEYYDEEEFEAYDGYDMEDEQFEDRYEPETIQPKRKRVEPSVVAFQEHSDNNMVKPVPIRPVKTEMTVIRKPQLQVQAPKPIESEELISIKPSPRQQFSKPYVVAPKTYADAQQIGNHFKQHQPIIVNLELADRDLVRRMIDFCSGLTFGLNGTIEKVADQVFLLSPVDMRISKEDKERIQRQRLYR